MSRTVDHGLPGQATLHARLTPRQEQILGFIRDFGECNGYAPSMREIAGAVDLTSTCAVSYQLSVLQNKGYLRRIPGGPRTVEVVLPGRSAALLEAEDVAAALDLSSQGPAYVAVDVMGEIAAGNLHSAEQVLDDALTLPNTPTGLRNLHACLACCW
jgi:repressor LexA